VFDTMRAYGGRVFRLRAHLRRLAYSAQVLGIGRAPAGREIAGILTELLRRNGLSEAALRVVLTRGRAQHPGLSPSLAEAPTLLVTCSPIPPQAERHLPVSAAIVSVRRPPPSVLDPGIKSLNYLTQVLALAEAEQGGAEEAIMLDLEGNVAEATAANLFVVLAGRLITPALGTGVMPGITRDTLLQLAPTLGYEVEERAVSPKELLAAQEVFGTSSIREIVPIVKIEGRPIGNGAPGPVTRRLMRAYSDFARGVL